MSMSVDQVDQFTLVVRLEDRELHAELTAAPLQQFLEVSQRLGTVDLRFTLAEQVEVWSVQDQNAHRSPHLRGAGPWRHWIFAALPHQLRPWMLPFGGLRISCAFKRGCDQFRALTVCDRSVDLCRVGRAVSEQVLDDTEVRAAIQHMRGEGVAQQVGMDGLADRGAATVASGQSLDRAHAQTPTTAVDEERRLRPCRNGWADLLEIGRQRPGGGDTEEGYPGPVAFPRDLELAVGQIRCLGS